MQLIGSVAGRVGVRKLGEDVINSLIVPTSALTGTGLAKRLNEAPFFNLISKIGQDDNLCFFTNSK